MANYYENQPLKHPQVFINYREAELHKGFISHLVKASESNGVNVYINVDKKMVEDIEYHFQRIKESRIALTIFSSKYSESSWCLDELVKIKEGVEEGKLVSLPIFYNLNPSEVKGLEGDFGYNLWNNVKQTSESDKLTKWKEALDFVSHKPGSVFTENSDENEFITSIIQKFKKLTTIVEIEKDKKQIKKDIFLGEENFDGIQNLENRVERKQWNVRESSTLETLENRTPLHQVFINFRGEDVGFGFVSHLVSALLSKGVNVFIDKNEKRHEDGLFKRIEESKVVVVVFSSRYSESTMCLDELVKIKDCLDERTLSVIPVFYKVDPSQVKQLNGDFGGKLWNLWRFNRDHNIIKWKEALESVASLEDMMGFYCKEEGSESAFVASIVEEVKKELTYNLFQEGKNPDQLPERKGEKPETYPNNDPLFGIEQRLEKLEKKLEFDCDTTRIIGVVGMPGIGKTTLAMMLHEKWNCKFVRCIPLLGIRKKSNDYGLLWLRTTLLKVLLGGEIPIINDETTHKSVKNELLQTKVFIVLDDVSEKKQIEFLLGDLKWIKKGSKIVITTCDKSLLKGLAHDTYLVPQMDNKEAFQLFSHHALDDQICSIPWRLQSQYRKSVDSVGGNPLALKLTSRKLRGKVMSQSEHKLQRQSSIIRDVWEFYIDQLNEQQKDAFLDIVCFFKSEDEYFVRSLVDSGDPNSKDDVSEVTDLANKFLITISGGRVDMNDLVYTFGMYLGSPGRYKLSEYNDIIQKLRNRNEIDIYNVRGIWLDMSSVSKSIDLESSTFTDMSNLRYLKVEDSYCPQQCKADCKLNIPDRLKFPLEKLRYLHWVNFPLKELPSDFKPENLVDLRLPYSNIERLWGDVKDTPKLTRVDLSHSRKLLNLSGLSKALNIQRLNLEGCTILDVLPSEMMKNMKSLIFLNLRGCIRLWSLPEMNLTSLKVLILSGCSSLKEFQLISKSIEFLHLDGTAINRLPPTIKNLQRLVLLNLKNCKLLECLPDCLSKLKDLEELVLTGCSRLKNLPDVKHSMSHVQILRLDRTRATEMPNISSFTKSEEQAYNRRRPSEWPHGDYEISALGRLCLSGNDIVSLQDDICKLYNLKWLDVKECKKLRSIPMLPPRIQYFDAHGCDSLERVSNPLALQVLTDHIHATFNFSNCKKLDLDAKESIFSYIRRKSQLMLDALSRHDEGFILEVMISTCLPGWKVPAWFSYRTSGSVLEQKLPSHWFDKRLTGIALCAVILFTGNQDQMNHLLVKCICEFKNEDGSHIRFSFILGNRSEAENTKHKIESSHVFIGYMSRMDINKYGVGNNSDQGCILTEASFEFKVTDGTKEVVGCDVLKCGFSFVYASDTRNDLSSVNSPRVDGLQNQSYSGLTPASDGSLERKIVGFSKVNNKKGVITACSSDYNTSSGFDEKPKMLYLVGVELRLKQLEKVLYLTPGKTRIIGVVGEPGIGKTTLTKILFEKRGRKFPTNLFLRMANEETISEETTHEYMKDQLLKAKSFIVLDGVTDKKQLEFLLGNLNLIKKGSKIVITTSDMSILAGFVHDTYMVPKLNTEEAFQLLSYHALDDQVNSPMRTLLAQSRRIFLDNTGGNPLALKLLGSELHGKDLSQWQNKMQTMTHSVHRDIQEIGQSSTDQLTEQHKDVFLDIVWFFRSEDEYYIRSLLDSGNLNSTDSNSEVKDLADKFMIEISDGRVDMSDLLYEFGKGLGSLGRYKLLKYEEIINKLKNMGKDEADNVRGIFIDISELTKEIVLERMTFTNMRNLRYLKLYDSCCPRKCKTDCGLHFPDGLRFTLEELRYLHWLKFPLGELPLDFRPQNLVNLSLPYSNITRVWEGIKEIPCLKWVDLSYSSKLLNISTLSKAENLLRLNLEGCTSLDVLPPEIQNMKSLVFLNLKGCILLASVPELNLSSLNTLILTDCSSLKEFQIISKSLEYLHLEGTSIKGLPPTIKNLQRLVLLNMKNCKMLEVLPECLCELKLLEELILSGCSMLRNFPYIKESMTHLQILRFDETGAEEMPKISYFTRSEGNTTGDMFLQQFGSFFNLPLGDSRVSFLHRLCLSGNDFSSLQTDIGQLYHLKWLDVKQCKKLTSIPILPPRLQYFDAHGCDSLEKVSNPLALPVVTENIHATFNFSNCNKLNQDAKDSIISYTQRKGQLVLDALSRYNEGIASKALVGTCFPGWEVPAWFHHRASGSVLKAKLPPHWFDKRFIGIALCAVIQFPEYNDHSNLSVQCKYVFKNRDGIRIPLSFTIGVWSKSSNTPQKIESSHVFIGYVRRLDVNNQEEICAFSETSLEFQVKNGIEEVVLGCKVLKCGFNLLYAPDERENLCWVAKTIPTANRVGTVQGEAAEYLKHMAKSRSDSDIEYQSYSCLPQAVPYVRSRRDDNILFQSSNSLNPERVKNVLGEVTRFGKIQEKRDNKYHPQYSRIPWTVSN